MNELMKYAGRDNERDILLGELFKKKSPNRTMPLKRRNVSVDQDVAIEPALHGPDSTSRNISSYTSARVGRLPIG